MNLSAKSLLLIVFLLILLKGNAQHHLDDQPSTHGMVIFGTERVYASHLPMFHAPHDYQVILEIEMEPQTRKKFISDKKAHPENETYTIAPETFVLPQMMSNPRPFKVVIYRGHFERGGTPISDSVVVKIKQIVYQSRLDKNGPEPTNYSMIFFGDKSEQFAVHQIGSPPDFDQIMLVEFPIKFPDGKYGMIELNEKNSPVGVSGNVIKTSDQHAEIRLHKIVYLEFEDLEN